MIENEIAKFENPLQPRCQLLLVAELGEFLLVAAHTVSRVLIMLPPTSKGLIIRPSIRDDTLNQSDGSQAICGGCAVHAAPRRASAARAAAGVSRATARSTSGSRPARTCSVPCRCSLIAATARWSSRCAPRRASRRCWALEEAQHLRRVRDVGDQVGHRRPAPRSSRARGAWMPVASASPTCRRMSALAVGRRSPRAPLERLGDLVERVAARPARRARRRAPPRRARPRGAGRRSRATARASAREGGSAGGCGSDTNVPPPRPRVANTWPLWASAVSAWRSVERAIPRRAHSSRSAGSRDPGASRPELDRRAQPVDGLLEGGLRAHRREHRLGRLSVAGAAIVVSGARHRAAPRLLTVARIRARAPSR